MIDTDVSRAAGSDVHLEVVEPKSGTRCAAWVLALVGLFAGSEATRAEWAWSFTPYLWATEVGADVSINDHEILEREVDLADVLDALDFALQFHAEGQNGAHGLMFDLTYYDLGDDDHRFPVGGPLGGEVVVKGDLEMTIIEAGGIYNPRGDGTGFSLLYGGRVLDFDEELDARYDFGPGSTVGRRYSASSTLFDALVGARFVVQTSDRFSWILRADVSGGGSELTWNAWTGFGWTFGEAMNKTLLAGYRYMEIELEEDDKNAEIESQLKLGGFVVGLKFTS